MTDTTNLVLPEMLDDAMRAEFLNLNCLFGTGAAIVKNGLVAQSGHELEAGTTIRMPRFNAGGPIQKVAEGAALAIRTLDMASETAVIGRYGDANSLTALAQMASPHNPEGEIARQFRVIAQRGIDDDLLTAAVADTTGTGGGTVTVHAIADGIGPTHAEVVKAKQVGFGDEQSGYAALAVNSNTWAWITGLVDLNGRPVAVDNQNDGELQRWAQLPLIVSDKIPAGESLLIKKNALVFWHMDQPEYFEEHSGVTHSTVSTLNFYGVAHRWVRMPGSTRTGVVRITHNLPA